MLTNLNKRRADSAAVVAPYRERSPTAFGVGEFIGETAVLAPIGGAAGAGAKGTLQVASRLKRGRDIAGGLRLGATGLAAEGAAVGAYNTGGEGDVAKAAATGAVTDLVIGGTLNKAGEAFGSAIRRSHTPNQRAASSKVDDALAEASERISDADEYGGFSMNTGTAVGTQRALGDLENLRGSPEGGRIISEADAQIERDVAEKARSFADEFGGKADDALDWETSGKTLQESLAGQRTADEKAYKELYSQFDELVATGDRSLDSFGLQKVMDDLSATHLNSSNQSTIKAIEADFARRLQDGNKPLTVGGVEDLIQDINQLWKDVGMSSGQKKAIRDYKEGLETYVDGVLSSAGGGDDILLAAGEARKARRQFSNDWEAGDIIQKITERTEGGEFAVDYYKSLKTLKASELRTLRARTLGIDNGADVMRSLQQAPLLEAFRAATKARRGARMEGNVPVFNDAAFSNVINRIPKETQVELWGEEFVEHLGKGMDAWAGRTIHMKGGSSESTPLLLVLAQQARFLSSGASRNFGMAASGMVGSVRNTVSAPARKRGAEAMVGGLDLPVETRQAMINDVLDDLEDAFTGAGGREMGDAIRTYFRVGAVNATTRDD